MAEFIPNNSNILEVVRDIVNKLGGKGHFIGMHARLGESFKRNATIHMNYLLNLISTK